MLTFFKMKQVFSIRDFKGFENEEVHLNNLTVFAGSNSVGKSSILQALLLSRFVFDRQQDYDNDITGIKIPVNGPFLLELGNTAEIIRRGKKVSVESEILFSLFEDGRPLMKIVLEGDNASQNIYELTVRTAYFSDNRYLLNKVFYYSAAERIGPRLKYEYSPIPFQHSGYRGERSFQILSGANDIIDEAKLFKPDQPNLLFNQVYEWLDYIVPGADFKFAERIGRSGTIEGSYGESLPTNVGFGISYVLPIIINGLLAVRNSTMIVENPEAHLHPSGQSRIGEFLSKIANADVQVIIETHSEHVINGLRISSLNGTIRPELVNINFIFKSPVGRPTIEGITLQQDGELSSYPSGFFDQDEIDLARIVRLRRKQS